MTAEGVAEALASQYSDAGHLSVAGLALDSYLYFRDNQRYTSPGGRVDGHDDRKEAVAQLAEALPPLLERYFQGRLQGAFSEGAPLTPEELAIHKEDLATDPELLCVTGGGKGLAEYISHLERLVAVMANDSEAYQRGKEAGRKQLLEEFWSLPLDGPEMKQLMSYPLPPSSAGSAGEVLARAFGRHARAGRVARVGNVRVVETNEQLPRVSPPPPAG
jgi:hypothetical protein